MTEFVKRGTPGLVSIKDLPVLQDAPPPGGFPSIRIDRRLPNTGPTGVAIFGIVAAVMGYGFYQLWDQKTDKRFQADEIYTVRTIVHPILQAEWDLRYLEHKKREAAKEAEIMKDVPQADILQAYQTISTRHFPVGVLCAVGVIAGTIAAAAGAISRFVLR